MKNFNLTKINPNQFKGKIEEMKNSNSVFIKKIANALEKNLKINK